jgi:hypothetical protein
MSNGQRQRSSVFGGLLLIVLGLLFLLARFQPNMGIWHLFWHFWPVLIIFWGIAKLMDNLGAQRAGQARPPLLSGGEAALLVLIIFVLVGMGLFAKIREKNPDMNIDMGFFNHKSTQTREIPPKTIPAGSHVTITTVRGNITVHAGDGSDIRVSVDESADGASEASAQDRMKSLNVVIEQTSDGYSVHPANSGDSGGHVTMDLDVTLPKKVSITANSNHGNISVSGVSGAVTASTDHGDIEVHDVGSDVAAQLSSGDARISNIAGSVRVNGHGNEIEMDDVAGDATLQGEFYGPVRVRNVTKTTHFASQKADLTLVHMTGRLELDSGEVDVSDVQGFAKLNTHNKDMEIENVAGRLDINDTHGDIKVRYSQPPREEINIANESGEVDLTLPGKSTFEISAISRSGDVQSEFEGPELKLDTEGETGRLNGKIGTLGPKIQIVTSYGTIFVHKSS